MPLAEHRHVIRRRPEPPGVAVFATVPVTAVTCWSQFRADAFVCSIVKWRSGENAPKDRKEIGLDEPFQTQAAMLGKELARRLEVCIGTANDRSAACHLDHPSTLRAAECAFWALNISR
jgi:hypothetical protein